MSDKPKRKNDEPIPRRYGWIFGILTFVLLIGLWFPIRVTTSIQVNLIFYGMIIFVCLAAIVRSIRKFHWKHTTAILLLTLLVGTNIAQMLNRYSYDYAVSCITNRNGIYSTYDCIYGYEGGCAKVWTNYVGVSKIPLVIETDAHGNGFAICIAVYQD